MPCFSPLEGWRSRHPTPNGKFPIVFDRSLSNGQTLDVPCGQCIGCRLDKSREWSVRMMHEVQMLAEEHKDSSFITLTYADAPDWASLEPRDWTLFMKRLRKKIAPIKVRFFMCGEYGEKYGRPHFHAIIFGYSFPDRFLWREKGDNKYYRSPLLEEVWTHGHCEVGLVTQKTCAYVARYVIKKVNGDGSEEHYRKVGPDGRFIDCVPEFIRMSNRPGLGKAWFEKYGGDCDKDFVTVEGRKFSVPKYYRELQEEELQEANKKKRILESRKRAKDNTRQRMEVRKRCTERRVEKLIRPLE